MDLVVGIGGDTGAIFTFYRIEIVYYRILSYQIQKSILYLQYEKSSI